MHLSAAFLRELKSICGSDHAFADPAHLRLYDADAYPHQRIAPDAVVFPADTREVSAVVKLCHRHRIPCTARGAGTGLSCGCLSAEGGIQIVLTRLKRILEIQPVDRLAVVQAGVVNEELNLEAAGYGLCFAPDPSSQKAATLGGGFAENSGGPHCLKTGVTLPHVLGATMVLADGSIERWGGRCAPGMGVDLLGMAIGSEGTFGIATELILRLIPAPTGWMTFLTAFSSVAAAASAVSALIARGIVPSAMELVDRIILQALEEAFHFGFPLDAQAVLILEIDGCPETLDIERELIGEIFLEHGAGEFRHATDPAERELLWKARKHAFGTIGRLAPSYATQDVVVPRAQLPRAIEAIAEASKKYQVIIGTVLHAGDGNVHPGILYDPASERSHHAALQAGEEIARRCIELGGSATGEHGIGLEKRHFLPLMFGPSDLEVMARLKRAFDPENLCNPGKILPPESAFPAGRASA